VLAAKPCQRKRPAAYEKGNAIWWLNKWQKKAQALVDALAEPAARRRPVFMQKNASQTFQTFILTLVL
jgi:hypothetical protein